MDISHTSGFGSKRPVVGGGGVGGEGGAKLIPNLLEMQTPF